MFDRNDMLPLLCVALVGVVIALAVDTREGPQVELAVVAESLPPVMAGVPLGAAPRQIDISNRMVELGGGYTAKLMESYVLSGRVVTRREYRHSRVADLSPLDLGIIWGDLLAPEHADKVRYSTGKRMIRFRPETGAVLPENWDHFVTNNHLIPASVAVRVAMMNVEVGQSVRLSGFLVSVTGNNLVPWTSSTRRDDGGLLGGCEIILVTGIEVLSDSKTPAAQQAQAGGTSGQQAARTQRP
jgi:hypothetical protein